MELMTDGPVLFVAGQLDVRCVTELRTAVYDHIESHPGHVVLDLAGVECADLTVLKMLAVASRMANQSAHRVTLRDCPAPVRRLLNLARLRTLVTVETSAEDHALREAFAPARTA